MFATGRIPPSSTQVPLRLDRGNIAILLVDDDPMVLAILKAVVTRAGYKVIAVSSPGSALEVAAEQAISMLITDFEMPGINGLALAKRLAKSRGALPVLILSGSHVSDSMLEEIAERNWNFMPKPIDRDRFFRIVDSECLGLSIQMRA